MLQYFDTLTDDSGNALLGATVQVLNWPALTNATIYSTNGTASPIANNTVAADITGQINFYVPDGAYQLVYSYKGTVYKLRAPVQVTDPLSFVQFPDTGAANAYVITDSRLPSGLYKGLKVEMVAANTNSGASTFNLNGTGNVPLTSLGGSALAASLIVATGIYRIEYDGTQWQLVSLQPVTAQLIGGLLYPRTAAEIAAGVTPTNYDYPSGTVDRYGTNITPGTTDMTAAITAAIASMTHQANGGVAQFLASTYVYAGTLNLATGVVLKGAGMYQTVLNWTASNADAMYAGAISNFGVEDLTLNGPGILSSTYCSGIFMDTGSSNGLVTRCFVTGFPQMPPFGPTTRGYGIDIQGTNIEVSYCQVEDSTYCIVLGGYGCKVLYNYINQHYSTKGVIPWGDGSTSQFWGGIDVGAFDFIIHGNYIIDCGAGNIYVGGNGGISQNGRITENFSAYSWDRCLDNGVVSTVMAGDNVLNIVIADNVLYNGRNNNLWLAGTSDSCATGNVCIYDANYDTWAGGAFVTYPGTRFSIGLYDGGAGAPLTNLTLTGNTSYDTVNQGISFSYGTNPPVGCTISGNSSPSGVYIYGGAAFLTNNIDVSYSEGMTVTASGWTGQTIASQSSSVRFQGKTAYWTIGLSLGTAATPSGNFVINLPYVGSMALTFSSFDTEIYNGWNTTLASDALKPFVSAPSSGQVGVTRIRNGSANFDLVSYTETSCSITIKGITGF